VFFQNAASEEKQLQYVYRVLGTPKIVGYKDFELLPLAGTFGRHIKVNPLSFVTFNPYSL
jgi:hypothetical protein